MKKYNDSSWIGQKFNMLTVLEPVHVTNKMGNMWYWRVKCDCGVEKTVRPIEVISGHQKSCGCYRNSKEPWNKSHDESHTRLHNIWCGMNNRCDPKHKDSDRYGKRGIRVCEEWKSYETFATWARENGYEDNLTIERMDVNGNYCPENCTWISHGKQARNRRTTAWVEYDGKEMSLAEAAEVAGLPYKQLWARIHQSGWTLEKALTTPIGAELGQKETGHKCVICGKNFTSRSCRSKYCSHECYLVYRTQKRNDTSFLPMENA